MVHDRFTDHSYSLKKKSFLKKLCYFQVYNRVVAIVKFNLPPGLNIQLFICPSEVVAKLKFTSWLEMDIPSGKIC